MSLMKSYLKWKIFMIVIGDNSFIREDVSTMTETHLKQNFTLVACNSGLEGLQNRYKNYIYIHIFLHFTKNMLYSNKEIYNKVLISNYIQFLYNSMTEFNIMQAMNTELQNIRN